MINKVSISNVGSLVNFSNSEALFPTGHSIVHGMNGSGKSQLSSILQKVSKLKDATQYNEHKARYEGIHEKINPKHGIEPRYASDKYPKTGIE